MRDLTGLALAADMAPGVNLWNTLDAYGWWVSGLDTQTAWGQPLTTEPMVASLAQKGFRTLRIPVTWYPHLGPAPDYAIDEAWMARVEEVANYALSNGMYAIVNLHHEEYHAPPTDPNEKDNHEGSWLLPTYAAQAAGTEQLSKMWTQIATRFRDYDGHLIFETMNEPRVVGCATEWTGGDAEQREVVNAFNLAAVNAIRATGGNNSLRFIMVPQVGANGDSLSDLVLPNSDPRLLVSVHNYSPYFFTIAGVDDPNATPNWGTDAEKAALEAEIKAYSERFVAQGQAVIVGEWGATDRGAPAQRAGYYQFFASTCAKYDVTPIAWIYSFNRDTLAFDAPELEDAMLSAFPR